MAELGEAATRLVATCKEHHVKFPKRWVPVTINRACRATLMLNNTATGFDQEAALNYMKQKYGTVDTPGNGRRPGQRKESSEIQPVAKVRPKKEETEYSKQRSRRSTRNGGGGNRDTSPDFAAKKYEIVTVEDNRPLVEAIKELGMLHFRVNEPKKGVHYMQVVKDLRQCKHAIRTREQALKIRGVAGHMADHIMEFLETGDIEHFEELRKRVGKIERSF